MIPSLQLVILAIIFTLYLIFGGSVFMTLEQGNEITKKAQLAVLRKDIQEILLGLDQEFYNTGIPAEILEAIITAKEGVLLRISETCGGNNLLVKDVNSTIPDALRWTFYNSVFFAFTAVTTIGYGNLAPDTHWSRIFTIFYALIGIPINGIILTKISTIYSRKLVKVHNRVKTIDSKITLVFNIIFYLIPGLLIFIILPAAFFVLIENWGYLDAVYFCFVTLTTIGFGDYVAGMGDGHNIWLWVYKIAIIFWIVFGLAYLVMILGFITKGITSKKVRIVLEKKLNRIRITREKLVKDMDYMRKAVNDLYLTAQINNAYLSSSTDCSVEFNFRNIQDRSNIRRSQSFCITQPSSVSEPMNIYLIRSFSESDLDRFNKFQVGSDTDVSEVENDHYFANLVSSLQVDIADVMKAVEDLDAYEIETNNNELTVTEESLNDDKKFLQSNETDKQSWHLKTVTETDEENLLGVDERSSLTNLEPVILHSCSETSGKFSTGTVTEGILDKVTGVLRKISSGNKIIHSEPSSRKVSRNESDTKIGHFPAFVLPHDYLDPMNESHQNGSSQNPSCVYEYENSCTVVPKTSFPRNTSQTSYGSDVESIPGSTKPVRRKISKTRENLPRNMSIDSQTLVDFLKVLDDVHERLTDEGLTIPASNSTLKPITPPQSIRPCHGPRNRKVGIFNPDFKYFSPELIRKQKKSETGNGNFSHVSN